MKEGVISVLILQKAHYKRKKKTKLVQPQICSVNEDLTWGPPSVSNSETAFLLLLFGFLDRREKKKGHFL